MVNYSIVYSHQNEVHSHMLTEKMAGIHEARKYILCYIPSTKKNCLAEVLNIFVE